LLLYDSAACRRRTASNSLNCGPMQPVPGLLYRPATLGALIAIVS
jgi:hypothetical protein